MASRTILLLTIISWVAHQAEAGFRCSGMGRRYCETDAVTERKCPQTCQKKYCSGRSKTIIESNGVSKYDKITWDELIKTGLFQHVYIDGSYLCVGVCWYKPWEAKCEKAVRYGGDKYCKHLNCEHDKGSKDNDGNRFAGCHEPSTGDRKKPFHKPTCEECEYLFPNACSSGKASESDDDSSEDGEGDSSAKRDVSSNTKDDSSDNDDSSGVSKNGEFGFFNDTEAELDSITDGFAYVPFEYAPDEWKALFVDEYAANDDVVVSLVNVILQFGDEIERVNKVAVIDVFSLVSAVEPSQVDILHMYDNSKTYTLEAGNTTETVIDNLVTVSVGIICNDPKSKAKEIEAVVDSEWINLFEIAGMTFLDKSLTADVKHVSRSMISGRPLGEAQIMPIEVQSASPVEKVEEAVSKMIGSKTIIWIAVGSSVTLSLALAAAMILYKKAKQQPAEGNDLKKAQVI